MRAIWSMPATLPSVAERVSGSHDAPVRIYVARDTGPVLVPEPTLAGAIRVESLRDQRANKLAAIVGRSTLRDLVDLYFLDKAGWPPLDGLADALRKDAGTDPGS